jgi:hypothetical protein
MPATRLADQPLRERSREGFSDDVDDERQS